MSSPNIVQTHDISQIAIEVAEEILQKLQAGTNVTWFLSGGSAVEFEVAIRKSIVLPLSRGALHICLIDERFGSAGHKHSNLQQLIDQGFLFEGCVEHPLLIKDKRPQELAVNYSKQINTLLDSTYTIAMFGIGTDGHTAGLLPFNPLMEGQSYYGSYRAKDFVRISATPLLLPKLDYAILYAMGKPKETAIYEMLQGGSIDRIPARILTQAKQLIIVTDQHIEKEEK